MEFSNVFVNSARTVFVSGDDATLENCLIRDLSLENNNVFNRFLVTNVVGDEIEVPIIARRHIESAILSSMSSSGELSIQTIVLPLYENSMPQSRRTFDSFIRQFFINTDYGRRLQKITSNKEEVYYGGRGLIFDDRYNPLIVCTLKARKVQESGFTRFKYFKPVIYVNPIVFTEPDKLINKGIIKKIIPYYTNRGVSFPISTHAPFFVGPLSQEDKNAIVIIDNPNRFFVKPTVPRPQSCTTESLNECLVNNIDDILAML